MTIDLFNYRRRQSSVTHVGQTPMGGQQPIRLQSMTTTSTLDTDASASREEVQKPTSGDPRLQDIKQSFLNPVRRRSRLPSCRGHQNQTPGRTGDHTHIRPPNRYFSPGIHRAQQ